MGRSDVVERLDRVVPVSFIGVAYRHFTPGRDALSGEGARINGGRWNPENSFSTLYLGLSKGVVLAEFARMATKQGRDIADFLPRSLSTYDVSLGAAIDLRDKGVRVTIDLDDSDLFADSPTATREIGEAAHYLGLEGVLAPSVTRTGDVMAVFTDRLRAGSLVSVQAVELLADPLTIPSP